MEGKGIPPVLTAAIAAAALAAGAVGGALFERGRRGPEKEPAPAVTNAAAPGPQAPQPGNPDPAAARPDVPPPGPDGEALAASRAEVARLEKRVAELEKLVPKEKTLEDRIALAKEMVECVRKGKRDGEAFRRFLALLNELCPEMGPYFLERLADPDEKAERGILLVLAMSAGGPEVADMVLKQLSGADDDKRQRILGIIGGGAREVFTTRNLPVTGPLADLAFQYAATGSSMERQAAAALLGRVDTVESRTALYRLASSDSETTVKEQAVRALGTAGDRDTLTWLDTYQPSLEGLRDWEKQRLQGSIDWAREQLKKKYP